MFDANTSCKQIQQSAATIAQCQNNGCNGETTTISRVRKIFSWNFENILLQRHQKIVVLFIKVDKNILVAQERNMEVVEILLYGLVALILVWKVLPMVLERCIILCWSCERNPGPTVREAFTAINIEPDNTSTESMDTNNNQENEDERQIQAPPPTYSEEMESELDLPTYESLFKV